MLLKINFFLIMKNSKKRFIKKRLLVLILFVFSIHSIFGQKLQIQGIDPATYIQSATISTNGEVLFFVGKINNGCHIYTCQKSGSDWGVAQEINVTNGFIPVIEGISVNASGNRVYFSANMKGTLGGFDIFYVDKQGDGWSEPEHFSSPVNSSLDETSPSISSDENIIVFARKKDISTYKNIVCKQIFISYKISEGNWSIPKLLPQDINNDCEDAPVFAHDNTTLFFSSIRERMEGDKMLDYKDTGFDVYFARMLTKGVWSTPQLMPDFSSEYNDMYLSIPLEGSPGFYTISDFEEKYAGAGIYQKNQTIKPNAVASVVGTVTDLITGAPLEAKISITKPETAEQIFEAQTDKNTGKFNFILQQDKPYILEAYQDGFSHKFVEVNVDKLSENTELNYDIKLFSHISLYLNVFDKELFTSLPGNISVKNIMSQELIDVNAVNLGPGRYKIQIPIGGNYEIAIDSKKFEPDTITFDVTDIVQFDEFEKDIELTPKTEDFEISIFDELTEENMDVEIEIKNMESNEVIIITDIASGEQFGGKIEKNEKGKYVIKLRKGGKYEINVRSPKGYAFYSSEVDLESDQKDRKLDVKLKPLNAQTTLELNDITFETNSDELNTESYTELDRVVKLMNDNPLIKIEISAHTDDVGSEMYNNRLSEKRAQSVVSYLVEKGVNSLQLIAKGYGESKPLVPNDSEENMERNRRVELKVVDVETISE